MNEKEFLKEHPSLKGKVIYIDGYEWRPQWTKDKGYVRGFRNSIFKIEDIHETQLDKQKVKDVIEENLPEGTKNWIDHPDDYDDMVIELKKELGLE